MPSLNPCALVGLVLAIMAGIAGWMGNGYRLSAEIESLKAVRSNEQLAAANTALSELAKASSGIRQAATDFSGIQNSLGEKIDAIQRSMKSAPPAPLPPDCKPTADRMRAVSEAVDAANTAATGAR